MLWLFKKGVQTRVRTKPVVPKGGRTLLLGVRGLRMSRVSMRLSWKNVVWTRIYTGPVEAEGRQTLLQCMRGSKNITVVIGFVNTRATAGAGRDLILIFGVGS